MSKGQKPSVPGFRTSLPDKPTGIVESAAATQELFGRLGSRLFGRRAACGWSSGLRLRVGRGRRLVRCLAVLSQRRRRFDLLLGRALLASAADSEYAQCGNQNKC